MKVNKYTSINRLLSKLRRDLGMEDLSESDVINWAGEGLEGIGAITAYEESVAFVEIKNHQGKLPSNLHAIIQIARNHCWSEEITENLMCPATVVKELNEGIKTNTPPNIPVRIDCEGMPMDAYEIAYYRPYFDLKYEYNGWSNSNYYQSCYQPIRLANHSFFNSVVCAEDNSKGLYDNSEEEYSIVGGDTIRTSFETGMVAIAYVRQMLDPETGYPMIPDDYSYMTAITKYITMKIMERHFYNNREGYTSRLQKAESDWHWYCKQASNSSLMPQGVDQLQNMLEQRQYLLPNMRRYYGFFGNMSRAENRKYNDPDNRNR